MNIDRPHDIVRDVRALPPEKRLSYVPITEGEAEFLADKDEAFREQWLRKSFRKRLRDLLAVKATP